MIEDVSNNFLDYDNRLDDMVRYLHQMAQNRNEKWNK